MDGDSYDQFDDSEGSSTTTLEAHLIELSEKIEHLEQKLEEASASAKEKEMKVLELEAILSNTNPTKKEAGSSDVQYLQGEYATVELELESSLKNKIEAEIEYLIITRTTQNWKVLFEDQIALFEEQKSMLKDQLLDQSQMIHKLKDNENMVTTLKEHIEKLEVSCSELLKTEEVLKLQNKAFRYSICFFVQLVMCCIALALFIVHLLPPPDGFVPT